MTPFDTLASSTVRKPIGTGGLQIDGSGVKIVDEQGYGYCDVAYRQIVVSSEDHAYSHTEKPGILPKSSTGVICHAISAAIDLGHEVTATKREVANIDDRTEVIMDRNTHFKKVGPIVLGTCTEQHQYSWKIGFPDAETIKETVTHSIGRFGLRKVLGLQKAEKLADAR